MTHKFSRRAFVASAAISLASDVAVWPGATTSGFTRLSVVGPRLLKATTWSGRSAIGSFLIGLVGKSEGHHSP